MPKEDTALTIFESIDKTEVAKAVKNLITGKTPVNEIRERVVGGRKSAKYVNTYFMTRQISLITGFRWSSECLEEKTYPVNPPYKYLGAKMKVTIWDKLGNKFSHESWGEKPITEGTGYFDQWKAAYSDGIKKALSYFGIANDVYGGKDLEFLGEEPPETGTIIELETEEEKDVKADKVISKADKTKFMMYMQRNNIPWNKVQEILSVDVIEEIKNFDKALKILKENL
jgi:hypothetical protein